MKIENYSFLGPFTETNQLENKSGVYVVLCKTQDNHTVVDIGESADVKARISNHDRKDCWNRNCPGIIQVAVLYTNETTRMRIEQELRRAFTPPCGDR